MSDVAALRIEPDGEGARVWVRARPGARRRGIGEPWRDHLTVLVREPPADGRANEAVLEVLADALGVRAGSLRLLAGHTHRNKLVHVPLAPDTVRTRLAGH